jgi:uncharacterized protein YggT (Ycf19 family)
MFDKTNIKYLIKNNYELTIDNFLYNLEKIRSYKMYKFYNEIVAMRDVFLDIIKNGDFNNVNFVKTRFLFRDYMIDLSGNLYEYNVNNVINYLLPIFSKIINYLREEITVFKMMDFSEYLISLSCGEYNNIVNNILCNDLYYWPENVGTYSFNYRGKLYKSAIFDHFDNMANLFDNGIKMVRFKHGKSV